MAKVPGRGICTVFAIVSSVESWISHITRQAHGFVCAKSSTFDSSTRISALIPYVCCMHTPPRDNVFFFWRGSRAMTDFMVFDPRFADKMLPPMARLLWQGHRFLSRIPCNEPDVTILL